MTRRDTAVRMDATDDLAHFRDQFVRPSDVLYLDGNSLGMLPKSTQGRMQQFVADEWGQELVRGWQHWVDQPTKVGDLVGQLIGAGPGQVLVCDTITTNLFKLASAVLDATPGRKVIVSDSSNFPTDRYVLQGVAERKKGQLRLVPSDPVWGVDVDRVHTYLADDVALVSFQHVDFRSGAVLDVAALTEQAHAAGAVVLWDLAHSVGSVPIDLDELGVDLAVGCTYKYLNSGPGSPAFLYVRRDLQQRLRNPIQGWWSTSDMFDMDAPYEPAAGITRFLTGSPGIAGMAAVEQSVAMLLHAGPEALRRKSTQLTQYLIELVDAWLVPLGFEVSSPREPGKRGGHVVIAHPEAYRIGQACLDAGVVPDVRPPNLVRLCPAPISTSFADVWDAVSRIKDVMTSEAYLELPTERPTVT